MDANGIDQSIISPVPDYEDPRGVADSAALNDLVADAVRRWPDRFPRGFGVVEPRHGPDALPEVDRALGELGLAGLMFHSDYAGVSLDHPSTFAIVERAARYKGVVILAHVFQHSILMAPFQLMRLADAFPGVTFIAANPMMTSTDSPAAFYMAAKCPNILFDTALTHTHLWPLEKGVKAIGADRMLFGSDSPYYTKCLDKYMLERADISAEDREKIFGGNAKRVFAL